MTWYLLRRLAGVAVVLLAISFFTYLIFFALSPDPAVLICGRSCTPDTIDQIRNSLGLDQPLLLQYFTFLQGILVGRQYGEGSDAVFCAAPCLGYSFQSREPVLDMLATRLPTSITLAVGAALLWLLFGITMGVVAGLREGKFSDKLINVLSLTGVSMPIYFVALAMQYVLVVQTGILPFPSNPSFWDGPAQWFLSYLMPWTVLAIAYAAMYTRITRANVIDTLAQNFHRTARAKGVSPRVVLGRHTLRPSLTPVVTLFGMDFAGLLGGALITETVFGLNGVGKLTSDSIAKNDQPVIMGVTLLAALYVVIGTLVVDLIYTVVDPRVRLAAKA